MHKESNAAYFLEAKMRERITWEPRAACEFHETIEKLSKAVKRVEDDKNERENEEENHEGGLERGRGVEDEEDVEPEDEEEPEVEDEDEVLVEEEREELDEEGGAAGPAYHVEVQVNRVERVHLHGA